MKKVVSIDFDIIMAPSIQFYNHLVPSINWDELQKWPPMSMLPFDTNHYQKIINFLLQSLPYLQQSQIHFIVNHDNIVNYITEPSDIYNIDHHHDFGYGSGIDKPNCANWGLYLSQKKLISSFYWINNTNSDSSTFTEKYTYSCTSLNDLDILKEIPIPDILVFVLSHEWVPPYYKPLFFTIMDICNAYFNTHFNFED